MKISELENWRKETEKYNIYFSGSEKYPFLFNIITKKRYDGLAGEYRGGSGKILQYAYATEELIEFFSEDELVKFIEKLVTEQIDYLIANRIIKERP